MKLRTMIANEATEKLEAAAAAGEIDPEAAARARSIMGFA
jgi:hypothetical protein